MSKKPHYEIHPEGWTFEGTFSVLGMPQDAFCVGRRFHATLTKDVPPGAGLHISVTSDCNHSGGSSARPTECIDAAKAVFKEESLPYLTPFPSGLVAGVWHIQEDFITPKTRRN